MRVLICGSRGITDPEVVRRGLALLPERPTEVIHGGARGADLLGAQWAASAGVPIRCFPADWRRHGRAAGPIRNQQMLDEGSPVAVLALWDGKSRGTEHMIRIAESAGIPTYICLTDSEEPED